MDDEELKDPRRERDKKWKHRLDKTVHLLLTIAKFFGAVTSAIASLKKFIIVILDLVSQTRL